MRSHLLTLSLAISSMLSAQVVINEVDYDQPGTDGAEFIEIKNIGSSAYPMQYLSVVFVNGAGGAAVIYQTISSASWPPLAPGDYFVICGNSGNTANCDVVADLSTNLIQNGPSDAIALVMLETMLEDVVAYGGDVVGYTEITGTSATDPNSLDNRSLNRWPDGTDTDNNDADFQLGCSTPGATNFVDPVECSAPDAIGEPARPVFMTAYVDQMHGELVMTWSGVATGPVLFESFNVAGARIAQEQVNGGSPMRCTLPLSALQGQLLMVRATSGTRQLVQKVLVP